MAKRIKRLDQSVDDVLDDIEGEHRAEKVREALDGLTFGMKIDWLVDNLDMTHDQAREFLGLLER